MSFLNRIFRRNEDDSDDLSLYNDEPTNNRLASVLFGLFALFVTLLIAGGLFFGSRAVYRALNGNSGDNVANQNKDNNAAGTKDTGANTTVQAPNSSPNSSQTNSSSASSDQSNKKTTKKSSSSQKKMPATGDNVSLPDTGDPGL